MKNRYEDRGLIKIIQAFFWFFSEIHFNLNAFY